MEWSSSDRFCFEAFQCFVQSWSNYTQGWHPGAQSGLPHAFGKLLGWFCRGKWREGTSENPSLQFMVFMKEIGLNSSPFWIWFVWTYIRMFAAPSNKSQKTHKFHLHVCVHPNIIRHSPSCQDLPRYHQKASDVQQEARSSKDERAVAETRSNPAGSKVVWKHARHRSREDAAIQGSSDGKILVRLKNWKRREKIIREI